MNGQCCLHSTDYQSCASCTGGSGTLIVNVGSQYIGVAARINLLVVSGDQPTVVDNVAINLLEHDIPDEPCCDPMSTSTGEFSHGHTDLLISGKGIPLEFTRSYRSMSSFKGSLGEKWTHNYAWTLRIDADQSVMVRYPEGNNEFFKYNAGTFSAPAGIFDTLVKNGDGTYTLTQVNAVKYNFSSTGKLTGIVDRNNNNTSVAYDANGYLSSVTDPGGRSLTFTPDASGRISLITDPLSRTVGFTYDANGDLTQVTDVKGGVTTYAYSGHRMTSLTDANNHLASQNIYDSANRAREQTDALGGKFCIYFGSGPAYSSAACPAISPASAAGQTITVDPRGKKTTYDFDTKFRTTSITSHDGNITSFTYSSSNLRTCVTDPLAHKTGYTYDTKGNVTGVIDANNTDANCNLAAGGVKWTYTYTAKNDVDLATDPLGRQTDYVYDANGNLTEVQRKDSGGVIKLRTCYTVNSAGLVTEQIESTTLTSCTGNLTKFEYDSYGNKTAVIDPRFSGAGTPKTTMTYDLGGRRLTVTNELNHTDTFTYDNQNNVLTSKDHLNHTTTNTYDAKGSLRTVTDANSKLTTYNYDNGDRLVSVADANNKTTAYTYDANGNRTSVVNANRQVVATAESGAQCGASGTGNGVDDDGDTVIDDGCPSVLYTYDNLNRLSTQKDALGNTWTYGYDAAGRKTSRLDAKGQQTAYGYNNRNDLTLIDYPAGTDTAFQYDNARNRTQMVDTTGTTTYTPDALNRVSSVTFPGARTVSYGYNNVGNRTTITYPGGSSQVTYGYDVANNLTSVTDWNSQQTAYAYDNAGNLTTVTLPGGTGVVGTYSYDTADRLTGISWVKGGNTLASAAYTLDNVGNRTQRIDQLGTHTYGYDNLYRLTSATFPGPATDTYTYDANGNRLIKNTTAYTYDAADRLTVTGGVSYGYDNNGNLTTRGSDTFAWDVEDRMTSATVGGTATTFAYNGDGLRNSRTAGGNTTTFTWDVTRSISQILDDGNFKYIYGLGRICEVGPGATTHYYLPDGLGSSMALVDSAGVLVNTYNYDVFGAVRSQTGSQTNEFQFTGEQVDSSTGLQYLRARYYDMGTGRFVSKDRAAPTVGDGQSLNDFAYVRNNPAVFVDPSGLWCPKNPRDCIKKAVDYVSDPLNQYSWIRTATLFAGGIVCTSTAPTIIVPVACVAAFSALYAATVWGTTDTIRERVCSGKYTPEEGYARNILGYTPIPFPLDQMVKPLLKQWIKRLPIAQDSSRYKCPEEPEEHSKE